MDHWRDSFPECGGQKQSPVNIEFSKRIPDHSLTPMVFTGFDEVELNLVNNGYIGE